MKKRRDIAINPRKGRKKPLTVSFDLRESSKAGILTT
jgi:hypothetical protein